MAGMDVTVQLAPDGSPLEPGSEAMFFVDPIAFDTGIAVREVARRPVDTAQDAVRAAIVAPDPTPQVFAVQLDQRRLQQHAEGADAIVRATVVGLEKVGALPLREHGPDYWRATMSVSHVEKGVVNGDQIQVLYINSLDVRHRLSPKPKASQEGIWLLHATEGPLRDLAPWMIPDPEDYQPVENLEVIRNAS
jgi:hypothetical protein